MPHIPNLFFFYQLSRKSSTSDSLRTNLSRFPSTPTKKSKAEKKGIKYPANYHPPHPSSSSVSFGRISSFFAGAGAAAPTLLLPPAAADAVAVFFAPAPAVDPVLASPLGSGPFAADFFCACAASQPAKSGSEPSSNGAGAAGFGFGSFLAAVAVAAVVVVVVVVFEAALSAPFSSSSSCMSSMSPHASAKSSSFVSLLGFGSGSGKNVSLAECAEAGGDDLKAWRWGVEEEAEEGESAREVVMGRLGGGMEGPLAAGVGEEEDWMSPATAESLLVKEEMAQPAQEAADDSVGCGVLIRGPPPAAVDSGGRAVSGMLAAAFRILVR